MAYDRDGSALFQGSTQQAASVLRGLNNEAQAADIGFTLASPPIVLFFPELRDIVGMFLACESRPFKVAVYSIEWSANATNYSSGTWTTIVSYPQGTAPPWYDQAVSTYRNNWFTLSLTGVKALRFIYGSDFFSVSTDNGWLNALHIYGNIASGQNPDRARIWHPTLNQEVGGAYFDWGDVARSTSASLPFRVKNNSATKTATSVTVAAEILTDATPTMSTMFEFSDDAGVSWSSSVNIGDLAPSAVSSVLYVRRTIAAAAQVDKWAQRIVANPALMV